MKKTKKQKGLNKKIISILIYIIFISVFCFAIVPKALQNDTFYTIKIGELIKNNGIDMMDHFSWHEGLSYTYPHWLYDLITYIIYAFFGMEGIYIATCILSIILGNTIFFVNCKLNKNKIISFVVTIVAMYLLKSYIAARAQLVTFILFILEIYFIEKFLESRKSRYAVGLLIIPILIANLHLAVFPFYFVLYLPYIAEYMMKLISECILYPIKSNEEKLIRADNKIKEIKEKEKTKETEPYKVIVSKNKNVKYLIIIMIIAALTGLLTPLGDTPYTYLIKTMQGNTTQSINEHLPLTLIQNVGILCALVIVIGMIAFTKLKIRLSDLFMIGGLIFLMFFSKRQETMFILIGSVIINRWILYLLRGENKNLDIDKDHIIGISIIFLMSIVVLFSYKEIKKVNKQSIVDESSYPVKACDYIIDNINLDEARFYNEYNYGSYLLFRGIPVFIDSRADLYAPEFSGKEEDIFTDFMKVSNIDVFYEDIFEKYNITHLIMYKNSKINMIIQNTKDERYKELYSDKKFIIYERVSENDDKNNS